MDDIVCGVDLGGTSLRIAPVYVATGELASDVYSKDLTKGDIKTDDELTKLIFEVIPQDSCRIGIVSAGKVNEVDLIVEDSPNSHIQGPLTFGNRLRERGHDVTEANDMTAVEGVCMFGQGKDLQRVLLSTYSSGYNCCVAEKGIAVTRAEFGHQRYIPLDNLFDGLRCGCGAQNHLEIFVSGNGATKLFGEVFYNQWSSYPQKRKELLKHPAVVNAIIRANDLREEGTPLIFPNPLTWAMETLKLVLPHVKAKDIFSDEALDENVLSGRVVQAQIEAIADSFGRMNSAYNPLDMMVLMGSQTKDWGLLFEPAIAKYKKGGFQLPSLPFPEIVKCDDSNIGIKGAVAHYINVRRRELSETARSLILGEKV